MPEPQGLPVDDLSPLTGLMLDVGISLLPSGHANSTGPTLDIGSATRGSRLVSTSQVWANHLQHLSLYLACDSWSADLLSICLELFFVVAIFE